MDYVHYLSKQPGGWYASTGLIGERTVPLVKALFISVVLVPIPLSLLLTFTEFCLGGEIKDVALGQPLCTERAFELSCFVVCSCLSFQLWAWDLMELLPLFLIDTGGGEFNLVGGRYGLCVVAAGGYMDSLIRFIFSLVTRVCLGPRVMNIVHPSFIWLGEGGFGNQCSVNLWVVTLGIIFQLTEGNSLPWVVGLVTLIGLVLYGYGVHCLWE